MRRALPAIGCLVALAGCDFDRDLDDWRCAHGLCGDPADSGDDGGLDAGFDAGRDAGTDAGLDAGTDAGTDAGADAGLDAGEYAFDAGPWAPDGSYNYVFITSVSITPSSFGGVAAGDALCAACARDAGLPGVFGAWLGLFGVNAAERISLTRARGWRRTDGKPFADQWSELSAGINRYPLWLDEHGVPVPAGPVITGAASDGDLQGYNCTDWTDPGGFADTGCIGCGGQSWADDGRVLCTVAAPLICFEVDQEQPVTLTPESGPIIFVSQHSWTLKNLADADAFCTGEGAVLDAGTFVALLSTTTAPAASRLTSDGGWVRPDGVRVGDLRAPLLDAPPVVSQTQAFRATLPLTGADHPTLVGTPTSTCHDWTMTSISFDAISGKPYSSSSFFTGGHNTCSSFPIYCVQP